VAAVAQKSFKDILDTYLDRLVILIYEMISRAFNSFDIDALVILLNMTESS
jgi:hypothetical protein